MQKIPTVIKFIKLPLLAVLFFGVSYATCSKLKSVKSKEKPIAEIKSLNPTANNSSLRDSIVNYGKAYLGTPYLAGGCGKEGFDCSGFVYFVFQHFNIDVPRSSVGFTNFGIEIPIESVQKGDILVFLSPTRNGIGHVGIVSNANGKQSDFIHATSGREMKVVVTNLANEGYTRRFVKAIRVI